MEKPRSKAARKAWLGAAIQAELNTAEGGQSDQLQEQRAIAWGFYRGELPAPPSTEGRSGIVSTDCADSVNANLAIMGDMLIRDATVSVEPEGEEDEAQALAESQVVNDVLMKDNPGEKTLLATIKDALILRNGCVKVWMEGQTCRVGSVPIENICFQANYSGPLQEIRFFAEYMKLTRAELVDAGISESVVYDLAPNGQEAPTTARARDVVPSSNDDPQSPDQQQIDCHEAYLQADLGDGTQRYRCLIANGSQCLEYEPVDLIPYALGTAFVMPHRLTGESVVDRLWPVQVAKSEMLRQMMDNAAVINNGRYIYDPSRVMEQDILQPTAGGGIRARDVGAIVPLMVPDIQVGAVAGHGLPQPDAI